MILFDFSNTLYWKTHFPAYLLSSKQNINMNLCNEVDSFLLYYHKHAIYDEELGKDGINSDFFSSICSSEFLSRFKCCILLCRPLCYFSFSARLTLCRRKKQVTRRVGGNGRKTV